MLFASPSGAGAIDALLRAVDGWMSGFPSDRPLRVAEIGVTWPGFTRRLLGRLARHKAGIRYVALTANDEALANLADTIAVWPGASGRLLDVDFETERFDLLLGLYPFTAPGAPTAKPAQVITPSEAVALLVPGGQLLVVEPTPSRLWRLAFVLLLFVGGTGLIAYIILWIFVPLENTPPYLPSP